MLVKIMNNYVYLKNISYKNHLLLFILIEILLLFSLLSFNLKVYSTFTIYGVFQENGFLINIDLKNSDIITKGKRIKIDDNIYQYKIEKISEVYSRDINNYQDYKIKVDLKLRENEVRKITFYYKKEKIIKKIIDYIF